MSPEQLAPTNPEVYADPQMFLGEANKLPGKDRFNSVDYSPSHGLEHAYVGFSNNKDIDMQIANPKTDVWNAEQNPQKMWGMNREQQAHMKAKWDEQVANGEFAAHGDVDAKARADQKFAKRIAKPAAAEWPEEASLVEPEEQPADSTSAPDEKIALGRYTYVGGEFVPSDAQDEKLALPDDGAPTGVEGWGENPLPDFGNWEADSENSDDEENAALAEEIRNDPGVIFREDRLGLNTAEENAELEEEARKAAEVEGSTLQEQLAIQAEQGFINVAWVDTLTEQQIRDALSILKRQIELSDKDTTEDWGLARRELLRAAGRKGYAIDGVNSSNVDSIEAAADDFSDDDAEENNGKPAHKAQRGGVPGDPLFVAGFDRESVGSAEDVLRALSDRVRRWFKGQRDEEPSIIDEDLWTSLIGGDEEALPASGEAVSAQEENRFVQRVLGGLAARGLLFPNASDFRNGAEDKPAES